MSMCKTPTNPAVPVAVEPASEAAEMDVMTTAKMKQLTSTLIAMISFCLLLMVSRTWSMLTDARLMKAEVGNVGKCKMLLGHNR